jgi:hypothetical protein
MLGQRHVVGFLALALGYVGQTLLLKKNRELTGFKNGKSSRTMKQRPTIMRARRNPKKTGRGTPRILSS